MSRPPVSRGESSESAAFEALLRALDPDRARAADRYGTIRERLRQFFAWRRAPTPDELVDETIDRVGRRLAGGEVIRAADVGRYFLGVARNVLREAWERERQRGTGHGPAGAAEELPDRSLDTDQRLEARLACLDRCLAELPAESRELALRYYEGQGGDRMNSRRRLAAQLGVSPATLRIRLHRIRARLLSCLRHCLSGSEMSGPGASPSNEEGGE